MKSLKESLINKNNINKVRKGKEIQLKKSNLRDGDLIQQNDGDIGIYNSDIDCEKFSIDPKMWDMGPTIIFFSKEQDLYYYDMKYYDEDLKDDGSDQYDAIKIIRGLFDPKNVNNLEKIKEFFNNKSYKKYF